MQKEQEDAEAAAAAAAQAEQKREEEALDNWEEMDVETVKLPGTQSAEEEVRRESFQRVGKAGSPESSTKAFAVDVEQIVCLPGISDAKADIACFTEVDPQPALEVQLSAGLILQS